MAADSEVSNTDFGCKSCRKTPGSRSQLTITVVRKLYEDSHEHFRVCKCSSCGQKYLEHFRETVYFDGRDEQMWSYWTALTSKELREIKKSHPKITKSAKGLEYLYQLARKHPRLTQGPDGEFFWVESYKTA